MGVVTGTIPWVSGDVKYISNMDARHAMWKNTPSPMRTCPAVLVCPRENSSRINHVTAMMTTSM